MLQRSNELSAAPDYHFRYRPDIDGLRAVAVLLVVLFHTGLGFSGGYVGVDVFFVISGYLITGLVLHQQARGTFSMVEFWKRRVRRILPAATLVVVVTLLAGFFLLLPQDLAELAESAIYQQLMAANIYFWHNTGYFDGPAHLKPLLHTWSLAVEEQFYLVYPLVLVCCSRLSQPTRVMLLILAAGLSFALAAVMVARHPGATFYSLPTRAWELLLGGILAACPAVMLHRRWQAEFFGALGLALIGIAGLTYDADTTFPGPNALIPCLGAAMVIAAGNVDGTTVGRWLAKPPVVFVGLISYSLYLWHWPLLVYQRYWYGDQIDLTGRLAVLVAMFALAILSWRFVEGPFRTSPLLTRLSGRSLATAVGVSMVLVVGAATQTLRAEGYPARMPAKVLAIIKDSSRPQDLKALDRDAAACDKDELPSIGHRDATLPISFVLWGDSHARALVNLCDELGKQHRLRGVVATRSGTPPLLNPTPEEAPVDAQKWNEAVLRFLRRNRVEHVIIVSRWSVCVRTRQGEDASGLAASLAHTIDALSEMGIRPWILMQVPEQLKNPQHELALAAWSGGDIPVGVTAEQHAAASQTVVQAFTDSQIDPSLILNPLAYCFDAQNRSRIGSASRSFYRDDDHLSDAGALHLIQPVLKPVFESIATQLGVVSDSGKTAPADAVP